MTATALNQRKTPYLDLIRTYAIIMVILLHSITEYIPNEANWGKSLWWLLGYVNEVARTGVPLFFMISGYLLIGSASAADIKTFYKHRFGKLLPCFLIYNIFYYVAYRLFHHTPLSLLGFLSEFLNQGTAYHLWFMYSLMMMYLFVPFLKQILDHCSPRCAFFFFLLAIFPATLRPFINTLLNGNLYIFISNDGLTGYIGYMILGYILGTYNADKKLRWIIYAFAILGLIIFPFWNFNMTLNGGISFLFNGGYTINHYLLASAIFLFCRYDLPDKVMKPGALAPFTFQVYLIHVFILDLVQIPLQVFRPCLYIGLSFLFTTVLSFLWGAAIHYRKHLIGKLFPRLFEK